MPSLEKVLLGSYDLLHLEVSFLQDLFGLLGFLFLRDELRCENRLLLCLSLDFFIHRVYEEILLLLLRLESDDVLLCSVCIRLRVDDLSFHLLVEFVDLEERSV